MRLLVILGLIAVIVAIIWLRARRKRRRPRN